MKDTNIAPSPSRQVKEKIYRLKITGVSDRVTAMKELRSALAITPAEAKGIIENLPYPLVESIQSYEVTGWKAKLKSCILEVEEKEE